MIPETIGIRAAQDSLGTLVDRVSTYGETIVITRHGKEVAVLINVDELAGMRGEIARLSGTVNPGGR